MQSGRTSHSSTPREGPLHPFALFLAAASLSGLVSISGVLTPVALLAAILGTWRFSADLGWTSNFFVTRGLLSRYQLWFSVAIVAQASSILLNRAMKSRELALEAEPDRVA
jgi:hypothetical protein